MGLFSSKKKIYVSGGISRIRPDTLIKNTTGYVIAGAISSGQDIAEALTINAISGTVGSYKALWNRAEKYYGLPLTSLSYYSVDRDILATTIQTDTGNTYPISSEITDVILEPIVEDTYVKYWLQEDFNYTVTINELVYASITYLLDSYTEIPATKYLINASRTKYLTTTTTKQYSVSYDVGTLSWITTEETTVDTSWYYAPVGTPDTDSVITYAYSTYDHITDPWSFGTMVPGTTYYPCTNPSLEYLCEPVIVDTEVLEEVTFDLLHVKPATTESILDEQTATYLTIPILWWQVSYIHSGIEYLWIGLEEDYPFPLGTEVDIADSLEDVFGSFAPVIPIRDDYENYTSTSNPTNYGKSKKLLRLIGLNIDDLTDQLTEETIADAYVTLQSKLVTDSQDELTYNYAFLDQLYGIGLPEYSYGPGLSDIWSTKPVSSNYINIVFSGTYAQRISWHSIEKTTITGTLTNPYEYEVTSTTGEFGLSTGTYTIKKRLTPTTYSEIVVTGMCIEYYVYYSSEQAKVYSAEWDVLDPDANTQLVLPVSLFLAKQVLKKDLETFLLRTTYVGVFSRVIVSIKWYQQSWFMILAFIIAIYFCQSCLNSLISTGATVAEYVGISFVGMTIESALVLAMAIGLVTYGVVSPILQKVLIAALRATGNDKTATNLVKLIYVIASVIYMGGKDLFTKFKAAGEAFIQTNTASTSIALEEIKDISIKLDTVEKELEIENLNEQKQQFKAQFRQAYNLFASAGEQISPETLDRKLYEPDTMFGLVKNYYNDAKSIPPAYITYYESLTGSNGISFNTA